jgi:hypothetical protein
MLAAEIKAAVFAAMQAAEELGGPEGWRYVKLMREIADEATRRLTDYEFVNGEVTVPKEEV